MEVSLFDILFIGALVLAITKIINFAHEAEKESLLARVKADQQNKINKLYGRED